MGIGVSSPESEERSKYDKATDKTCRVNIPVAQNARNELVSSEQHIVESNHLAGDELELARNGKE